MKTRAWKVLKNRHKKLQKFRTNWPWKKWLWNSFEQRRGPEEVYEGYMVCGDSYIEHHHANHCYWKDSSSDYWAHDTCLWVGQWIQGDHAAKLLACLGVQWLFCKWVPDTGVISNTHTWNIPVGLHHYELVLWPSLGLLRDTEEEHFEVLWGRPHHVQERASKPDQTQADKKP